MRTLILKKIKLFFIFIAAISIFAGCAGEEGFPVPDVIMNIGLDNLPLKPNSPFPADSSTSNFRRQVLSWSAEDLDSDSLKFDVFLNTTPDFSDFEFQIASKITDTFIVLETIDLNTQVSTPIDLEAIQTYYWKVDILDSKGNWIYGDIWKFETGIYINNPPDVEITSPNDNTNFTIYENINFIGTATDIEDSLVSPTNIKWKSSIDGDIGIGLTASSNSLSGGLHTITLEATDIDGNFGSKEITITVNDTTSLSTPPSVKIISPLNNNVFASTASITFRGEVSDLEDGTLPTSSIQWTSSRNGPLGVGSVISVSNLEIGLHTITLKATDSSGASSEISIQLEITASGGENQAPTAIITSPANSSAFIVGQTINFSGTGTDPEDGTIQLLNLVWTSDIDGAFELVGFTASSSQLSKGRHVITLTAMDTGGLIGTDNITIFVGDPNNTSPHARFSVSQNTPVSGLTNNLIDITLDANASFDIDDVLSNLEVRWDFDNNGTWDTNFSASKTENYSYNSGNKPHKVSIEVRDPGGLSDVTTLIVPELLFIPAGNFNFGSVASGQLDEQPQLLVNLSGYYIGKYEVTNEQFAIFLSENGNEIYYSNNMEITKLVGNKFIAIDNLENYPVMYVDWFAADAYSKWLNGRLPTEAEWEKAAKGGIYLDNAKTALNSNPLRDYPWGSGLSASYANYEIAGKPFFGPAPVGTFNGQIINSVQTAINASPYNIFDMLGNAGEWVNDNYEGNYVNTALNDPQGPPTGSTKVIRGGMYDSQANDIRISKRFSSIPTARPYNIGFRIVINP